MTALIRPYGGPLVDAVLGREAAAELARRGPSLPSIVMDAAAIADLELIATGGASPVRGFMSHREYRAVLDHERLSSGLAFPVPLTLPIPVTQLGALAPGEELALRDEEGVLRGVLRVEDAFVRDRVEEARLLHGTEDPSHPDVRRLLSAPSGAVAGEIALLRPRGILLESAREVRLRLAADGFFRVAAGLGPRLPEGALAAAAHADALLVPAASAAAPLGAGFPVVRARLPWGRAGHGVRDVALHGIVLRNFGVSHVVLDGSLDLVTAHALLRYGRELGLVFVHANDPTAPVADVRRAAAGRT